MFLNEDNQVGVIQLFLVGVCNWGVDCLGCLGD